VLGAINWNLTRLLQFSRILTRSGTASAHVCHWSLRKHGVAPFVWKKEILTWRYLFMKGQKQDTSSSQPGPSFLYVKPSEARWKQGGLGVLIESRRVLSCVSCLQSFLRSIQVRDPWDSGTPISCRAIARPHLKRGLLFETELLLRLGRKGPITIQGD
jgi:hypothetical protein